MYKKFNFQQNNIKTHPKSTGTTATSRINISKTSYLSSTTTNNQNLSKLRTETSPPSLIPQTKRQSTEPSPNTFLSKQALQQNSTQNTNNTTLNNNQPQQQQARTPRSNNKVGNGSYPLSSTYLNNFNNYGAGGQGYTIGSNYVSNNTNTNTNVHSVDSSINHNNSQKIHENLNRNLSSGSQTNTNNINNLQSFTSNQSVQANQINGLSTQSHQQQQSKNINNSTNNSTHNSQVNKNNYYQLDTSLSKLGYNNASKNTLYHMYKSNTPTSSSNNQSNNNKINDSQQENNQNTNNNSSMESNKYSQSLQTKKYTSNFITNNNNTNNNNNTTTKITKKPINNTGSSGNIVAPKNAKSFQAILEKQQQQLKQKKDLNRSGSGSGQKSSQQRSIQESNFCHNHEGVKAPFIHEKYNGHKSIDRVFLCLKCAQQQAMYGEKITQQLGNNSINYGSNKKSGQYQKYRSYKDEMQQKNIDPNQFTENQFQRSGKIKAFMEKLCNVQDICEDQQQKLEHELNPCNYKVSSQIQELETMYSQFTSVLEQEKQKAIKRIQENQERIQKSQEMEIKKIKQGILDMGNIQSDIYQNLENVLMNMAQDPFDTIIAKYSEKLDEHKHFSEQITINEAEFFNKEQVPTFINELEVALSQIFSIQNLHQFQQSSQQQLQPQQQQLSKNIKPMYISFENQEMFENAAKEQQQQQQQQNQFIQNSLQFNQNSTLQQYQQSGVFNYIPSTQTSNMQPSPQSQSKIQMQLQQQQPNDLNKSEDSISQATQNNTQIIENQPNNINNINIQIDEQKIFELEDANGNQATADQLQKKLENQFKLNNNNVNPLANSRGSESLVRSPQNAKYLDLLDKVNNSQVNKSKYYTTVFKEHPALSPQSFKHGQVFGQAQKSYNSVSINKQGVKNVLTEKQINLQNAQITQQQKSYQKTLFTSSPKFKGSE